MTATIFAGPSLFGINHRKFADLDFRPPAACGDLLAAVRRGAATIGLIDGTFENTASVWHKEILAALDRGVRVFGAASMGALRAAECHDFGMIGIGEVFADYRDGRRTADADVAVMHAPEALEFRPLTEALVDVDATVARMWNLGLLDDGEAIALGAAARRIHYKDRTWDAIVAAVNSAQERQAEIYGTIRRHRASLKQADALALLNALAEEVRGATTSHGIRGEQLQRTLFLDALEARIRRDEGEAA